MDFERAILELKWLGKDDDATLAQIADKYGFPPDFIRKGTVGLTSEDHLMGKSKWWPILAQWNEQYEEAKYRVEKAIAYRARASWELIAYLGVAISAVFSLFILSSIGVAITGTSVTIGLFVALYRRSEDWNVKVEEEIHNAQSEGYPEIGRDFTRLATSNPLLAYFVFKRFSKERAPHIAVDLVEVQQDEKGHPVPVFLFQENVDVEYRRRIDEMEPGLEFSKNPFDEVNSFVEDETGNSGIRFLTVTLRNGDLALSKAIENCRVGLRNMAEVKVSYLPLIPTELPELRTLDRNSGKEVWETLRGHVSFDKFHIPKGGECRVLLGFALESTGDFYFATEPPSVMYLSKVSIKRKHKDSVLAGLPFKLIAEADDIASVISGEITLIGLLWNDLHPVFIETHGYDGKRISFTRMETEQ